MPSLRLRVNAEMPNALVPDIPFVGRREFGEIVGFEVNIGGGGTDALPVDRISAIEALIVQTDKEVTVDLGEILLQPGGLIVVYNGSPAVSPPTVANAGETTAKVRGAAFGGD